MEFEFEKATFGKQTEFAKNVLKKQDEDVKVLAANSSAPNRTSDGHTS